MIAGLISPGAESDSPIRQAYFKTRKLAFGAIMLLGLAAAVQAILQSRVDDVFRERYQSYLLADELRQSSDDLTRLARTYAATGDAKYEKQYLDILDIRNGKKPRPLEYSRIYWDFVAAGEVPRGNGETISLLTLMKQAGFTDAEFDDLKEAQANSDGLVKLEVEAMNAVKGVFKDASGSYSVKRAPDMALAQRLLNSDQYHTFKAQIMKPIDRFFVALDKRTQGAIDRAVWLAWGAWLALAAAIFAVGVCIYRMSNQTLNDVLDPLVDVSKKMIDLANDDLNVELRTTTAGDEISAMWRSLHVFRENAVARKQQEADMERRREDAINEERSFVARSLGEGMERLAAKDLTFRLDDSLPAAYSQLRNDFNQALDQLEDALARVHDSSDSIASGSNEISSAADDLSRRTEVHATALKETAVALNEITATVSKTAEGAKQAQSAVQNATSDAEKGESVVQQAIGAMNKISNSSREINQIIGVIDDIAFQTNLLALNAGVEAARAGHAGRGFAVVAAEVRSLAQRSAEAAKQIKTLISASATEVKTGVDLAGQSGEVLQRIVQQITSIKAIVTDIASDSVEQAGRLQEVNTSVGEMDSVTQHNAALSEESSAASQSLARESGELADLIDQFAIRAASKASVPVGKAERSTTSLAQIVPKSVSHAVPAKRNRMPAAMVKSKKVANGSDDWQEF